MTIKQAFQKLASSMNAAMKNPFFINRRLRDDFIDIAENIVDEGGNSVSVDGIQTQGTKIGTVTVDNVPTDLYAPSYRIGLVDKTLSFSYNEGNEVHVDGFTLPSGSDVSFSSDNSGGDSVGTLTIDGVSNLLYAPHVYSTSEKKVGTWTNGKAVYEKSYALNINIGNGGYTNFDNSFINKPLDMAMVVGLCFTKTTNGNWLSALGAKVPQITVSQSIGAQLTNDVGAEITNIRLTLRYVYS